MKEKVRYAFTLVLLALFLGNAPARTEEKQNPEAIKHYNAGVEFTRSGDFAKAVKEYQKSLELDPENVQTLYGLGLAHRQLNQLDEAILFLGKAVKINPRYVDAYYELGLAYWMQKKYDESINQFITVTNFGPEAGSKYTKAYYSLGRLHYAKKDLEQAQESLQMAVALDPEYVDAHYYLGEVFREQKELTSSIEAYRQAVALDSSHDQAFYKLGSVYKEDGQYEEAVEAYKKVIQLKSKWAADSRYRLAVVYNAMGRLQDAVTMAQEYLKRKPSDAKALMALGEAYEGLGQHREAIAAYTKAAQDSRWNQYATHKIKELKESLEEE
ncbi:MAG: hypothetical protein AMJ92_08905 [candidate division Zixibacteria bacterium SM23_81]|nr:MAG: hypothetical protein AMJ92_08905 [candidate division Zixibacteria bacterium SM23_81]